MKKTLIIFLSALILFTTVAHTAFASGMDDVFEEEEIISTGLDPSLIAAKSAVLMDAETGTLLYAKNPNEALAPASVTKIMTLLLVAEALQDEKIRLDEKVLVSEHASSMGGSQVFIKEGEEFTVEELLKSTVIASANDAAVALAELVSGSEKSFVDTMNQRAQELGMNNTVFENVTGLDDDVKRHLTSAYDIAIMSKELIKHDIILKYSTKWQDSIRNGEFTLTNTNRLVRYYSGCTGLKTGSTDKAGFCISATAKRDGMHLIAVVMGSETRDERNNTARTLLDWGFSNYAIYSEAETNLEEVPIYRGIEDKCMVSSRAISILLPKSDLKKIEKKYEIPEYIDAPMLSGQKVGKITYYVNEKKVGESEIFVKENIEKTTPYKLWFSILSKIVTGK